MRGLQAARSSLTPMVAGVPMVVALSLARILRKWTDQRLTSAGRWPSLLSRVVSASAPWCSSRTIGVAKPLSLFVETYGTEQGQLTADDITNVIKIAFDCRPGAIAQSLALREPKYQETAAYCHFGREAYTKDGIKFFEWENAKDLSKFASMTSVQVTAELKSSNYLTKWVD